MTTAAPTNPPLTWVDSHVHLNFPDYTEDLGDVVARMQLAGVEQVVHSCVTPGEFPAMAAIAQQHPSVFFGGWPSSPRS